MNTFDKVKDIVVSTLGCDPDAVTAEAVIIDDLGADSLSMVELVMAMEDAFGISVPEEQAKEIKTVGDVVKLAEANA